MRTALVAVPDDAAWLVNATPSSTPCAKTEIDIFAVCWRKKPVETCQLKEFLSINSHKAARREQGVTGLLMLRIEFPAVKPVFEIQAGWAAGNLCSIPIIAPRRNGKNLWRLEMPY